MTTRQGIAAGIALAVAGTLGLSSWAHDQPAGHPHAATTPAGPVRVTTDELHRHGGAPPGWRFAFPTGDPKAGRTVFVKLECFKCHAIQGEPFPEVSRQADEVGPELTGVGSHHPAEYVAESILNPNAVIVEGPGYTGPDGLSVMPDYRESLTVSELIDLVAFLQSLTGGEAPGHEHAGPPEREQRLGDYWVRVEYHEAETGDHHHHHGTGRTGRTPGAGARGRLMVFVEDAQTREAVPYLPVSATIYAERKPAKRVRLVPTVGEHGFHYGADVVLPEKTTKVTVAVGAPTMRVLPAVASRFAKPGEVSFEWGDESTEPARHGEPSHGGSGGSTGHSHP